MKLLIINGSPRKTSSNTTFYMDFFIEGFLSIHGNHCDIEYIGNASSKRLASIKDKILSHDNILFAFPVYYHSVPGNVRALMENLNIYTREKKFSFFIQQTYINSERSMLLIEHLKSFCVHINVDYNGTALKGAGPTAGMLKKIQKSYYKKIFFRQVEFFDYAIGRHLNYRRISQDLISLGVHYGKRGIFDSKFVESYMYPTQMSKKSFFIHKIMAENIYFRKLLKKYKTLDIRYAMPLIKNNKSNQIKEK